MFPMMAFAAEDGSSINTVAKIGDVEYQSLDDAIDAVGEGETITLLKRWEKAVVIGAEDSVDFTLDLNGNSIIVNNAVDAVSVYSGSVVIKNGAIENKYYSSSSDFTTAVYAAANVELYNMELQTFDSYSSTCYVEDEASLIIDDGVLWTRGKGADCITTSYQGKAIISNTQLIGSEQYGATSFYKEQYGAVAYGELQLENVEFIRIECGVYVESEKPVSIISCNTTDVGYAIYAFNSTDVTIERGNYIAVEAAFYGENSKVVIGESTWKLKNSLDSAFYGAECITLKSDVSPSIKDWNNETSVKFYKTLPKAYVSNTGSYGAKAVRVRWNAVPGAAKYEIYRSTKASSGYIRIKTVTAVEDKETYSFINTGRTRYKTYYYRVKAIGYNPKVTSTSGYKKVKVDIATPKLNINSYTGNWIAYRFNHAPGANGYKFYYKVGKNGKWKLKGSGGIEENWHEFGFTFGKTYYLKMRAYDKVDGKIYNSAYSNVVKYYHKPPAVQNLKVVNSAGNAKLTWNKALCISGYQIYRSTSKDGTYTKIKTLKGASNKAFTDKTVKEGRTYYYKIRSYAVIKGKTIPGAFSSKIKITL